LTVSALRVGGDAATWSGLGFTVDGLTVALGTVAVELVPGATGIVSCAVGPSAGGEHRSEHANTATHIDHVVVLVASVEAYAATVDVPLKRVREGPAGTGQVVRQGFFRSGEVIVEAVEVAGVEEPRWWGLTVAVDDLDAAASVLGDKLGRVKDAVQPGRRIATVRKEASGGLPLAFISA
jgi:hypothetical protein